MTDYIEKIQYQGQDAMDLSSPCFNGGWTSAFISFISGGTLAANTYYDYSLANYLPNDGYDYEVMFTVYASSNNVVNQNYYGWLFSGLNHNWIRCECGDSRSGTAQPHSVCRPAILPIRATDKYVSLLNNAGNATASGSVYFNAVGYKRIGKNTQLKNNSISQIQFPNSSTYVFKSPKIQGKWVKHEVGLLSDTTLAYTAEGATASSKLTVSLSNDLPNDNYNYEVIFHGQINSSTATNNLVGNLRAYPWNIQEIWVSSVRNDANNDKISWFNFRMPIPSNNRNLYLANPWANTNIRVWLNMAGYRRLGQ